MVRLRLSRSRVRCRLLPLLPLWLSLLPTAVAIWRVAPPCGSPPLPSSGRSRSGLPTPSPPRRGLRSPRARMSRKRLMNRMRLSLALGVSSLSRLSWRRPALPSATMRRLLVSLSESPWTRMSRTRMSRMSRRAFPPPVIRAMTLTLRTSAILVVSLTRSGMPLLRTPCLPRPLTTCRTPCRRPGLRRPRRTVGFLRCRQPSSLPRPPLLRSGPCPARRRPRRPRSRRRRRLPSLCSRRPYRSRLSLPLRRCSSLPLRPRPRLGPRLPGP